MAVAQNIEDFWQNFMQKSLAQSQPASIFRGVSDKTHDLRPSIARHAKEQTGGDVTTLETNMLNEFKRLSLRELEFEPESEFEWLFLAQHHGLPTRLLDWSTNPLVSLYFAVERNDDRDGVLYQTSQMVSDQYELFDYRTANTLKPSVFAIQSHQGKVIFVRPKYKDRRYHNQASVFSCPAEPYEALTREVLHNLETLIVPYQLKPLLRERLRQLGISASFIYPGLDGIASEVKSLQYDPVRSGRTQMVTFRATIEIPPTARQATHKTAAEQRPDSQD
jgi:hypothetical protein